MMNQDPALEKTAQHLRLNGYIVTPPGFASHIDYQTYMRARNVLDWLDKEEISVRTWSALTSCCREMNVGQLADGVVGDRFRREGILGQQTLSELKEMLIRHGVISREEGSSDAAVAA